MAERDRHGDCSGRPRRTCSDPGRSSSYIPAEQKCHAADDHGEPPRGGNGGITDSDRPRLGGQAASGFV